MNIAVIIITYNAKKWIEKSIKPLEKIRGNNKVYIVDNGSTDGTQNIIKSKFPQFNLIESKKNLGFGKANNLAFQLALRDGADYFFLLNQDAYISWDNIIRLSKIQYKNPDYGILSPIQMYNDTSVDFLHYKSLLAGYNEYFNDLISNNDIKEVYTIEYTNAALWMISRKCLETLGGFEPLFRHYGEDHEYANRLSFFNLKFGLCPNIKGFHYRHQIQEERIDENKLFIRYLIQVRNLNENLFISYLKIIFRLVINTIYKPNGKNEIKIIHKLKTFYKVLILFNKVRKNRVKNIHKKYSFIIN